MVFSTETDGLGAVEVKTETLIPMLLRLRQLLILLTPKILYADILRCVIRRTDIWPNCRFIIRRYHRQSDAEAYIRSDLWYPTQKILAGGGLSG